MAKRAFDLVVSAALLTLLLPLFLAVAIAVRLDSPGSIFYRGRRVGQHGQEFWLYKFRTMIAGSGNQGPGITSADDPRITRIGRLLRRTKFDELPQLINVLRGEMSLVGPRPEDPHYVALYTPEQRAILRAKPGITSPASIRYRDEERLLSGHDWETHYIGDIMPAKLAVDLEYQRRATLWRDIGVLVQTLLALWR